MKKIYIYLLLLLVCMPVLRASMPEFPTTPVTNYDALKTWFNESPHTVASFEMKRIMNSGRILNSKGTFEYRRGMGMMWRTERPVRNAMVIKPEMMELYDSRGKKIRSTSLAGGAASRFTQAFMQELSPNFIRQLEKRFALTCRNETASQRLLVGMKAKNDTMDLQWLLMVANSKGELEAVYYESHRQGRTEVRFNNVQSFDNLPSGDFPVCK